MYKYVSVYGPYVMAQIKSIADEIETKLVNLKLDMRQSSKNYKNLLGTEISNPVLYLLPTSISYVHSNE